MRYWAMDPSVRNKLKQTPIRIRGSHPSRCCGRPTLLVQSRTGGFVTANCSAPGCNRPSTVSEREFRTADTWISCPECRRRMTPGIVARNYAMLCHDCDGFLFLADILPGWSDVAVA